MRFACSRRRRHDWRRRILARDRAQHGGAFRVLLDTRFWARHPETFAKSWRGRDRRAARRFVIAKKKRRPLRRAA